MLGQLAAEASSGSGTSHATDAEAAGAGEGGGGNAAGAEGQAELVERSSKSLSALKPACPPLLHACRPVACCIRAPGSDSSLAGTSSVSVLPLLTSITACEMLPCGMLGISCLSWVRVRDCLLGADSVHADLLRRTSPTTRAGTSAPRRCWRAPHP